MGTTLDLIEARLQALIESTVVLFARGDDQHRLAHQLVEAAQANIYNGPDGSTVAPSFYTIFLHPDVVTYWQAHRDQLNLIEESFQQAAREYGLQFTSPPVLRLSPDPQLALEGIRVVASHQLESAGQTAAFTAVPTTPRSSIPRNAFLIVDGNQVFTLNRMVINIGRRPDNNLVISDPRVSRTHAQIRAIRGQYILFDLNSTGGTLVNGRRIHQCALKPGDVISLSGVPLIYGEDPLPDEDTEKFGYTQNINPSSDQEPPEVIE
ncbi:MAG: DUF3662 domain-containing protein [Chloroflexi bacterium]|nr:DUF3662 domain-containing protein [Chloroflexota bacterium]